MDALLPMQLEGGGLQWRQRGIRRKKAGRGKENRSHSSLGRGLLGATEAAHHCQDWGGKLLTSARSCTGEPLRVYVSLILIRSCCWNVVRMIMFIRKETRARHLRLYRSKISALCALKKKKEWKHNLWRTNSPSVGWGLWWPAWQFPGWVLGPRYCSGRGAAAGMSDQQIQKHHWHCMRINL